MKEERLSKDPFDSIVECGFTIPQNYSQQKTDNFPKENPRAVKERTWLLDLKRVQKSITVSSAGFSHGQRWRFMHFIYLYFK